MQVAKAAKRHVEAGDFKALGLRHMNLDARWPICCSHVAFAC